MNKPRQQHQNPTTAEYSNLQSAYDSYNEALFNGTLPNVLVTLQRHAKAYGYFAAHRFGSRSTKGTTTHELALNPDGFTGRTDQDILSTLVHEMAHVWQEAHGTPPRRCYHDKQWATKMKEIGLQPTATGLPGGKETGPRMTHLIMENGPFAKHTFRLLKTGFKLNWQSLPAAPDARAKKASKTKFTCPECGQNAWGKPGANLICGECYEEDSQEIVLMLAEPADEED